MCAHAFERLFHLQITKSRSLKAQSFTSMFHFQKSRARRKYSIQVFDVLFRFEVARNDHVELQASIFTFLSHSPRPWRAHGGVWSQMLTGWAASGCKEDCRTRMLRVFGNWWPILVLPHRRVPRKRSAWRCYCSCLTVLLLCLAVCGVYPCFCGFLFSLSKTASARCVLNVPLLPQDFL